jgi:hypothetical protein
VLVRRFPRTARGTGASGEFWSRLNGGARRTRSITGAIVSYAGALQLVYYDAKTGGACRECFFDRDIDAADLCLIHAHMSDEVAAAIRARDIHGLTQFLGFPLRRGNDPARIF